MTNNINRNVHFDVLRIIAMILVMLFHYTTQFSKNVQATSFPFMFTSKSSGFAVALFLYMVGFFSYNSLVSSKTFISYLKKRFFRLYPTFLLCLSITTLVLKFSGTNNISIKQYLLNAVLINRFVNVPFVDGAYWYLLIVVLFTLIISVCKILNVKLRICLYAIYTIIFIILGLLNRFIYSIPEILSFAFLEYINKCFLGLFIAYSYFEWSNLNMSFKSFFVSIIVLLSLGEFLWIGTIKSLFEIIALIVFVIFVLLGNKLSFNSTLQGIIHSVSSESYFVYLIHQQVGFVFLKFILNIGINCTLALLFTFIFIIILSTCHFYAVRLFNYYIKHNYSKSSV